MFIAKEEKGAIVDYGPLWAGERMKTLKRSVYVLKGFLNIIVRQTKDWWDLGSDDGGGLAMNDGVVACLEIFKSILSHFERKGIRPNHLSKEDLLDKVKPYAEVVADYLGSLDDQQRIIFRQYRGVQGVVTRRRECEEALNKKFQDFKPPGLVEALELKNRGTNREAYELINEIENIVTSTVYDELVEEFGIEKERWWYEGIPTSIGGKAVQKQNEDKDSRGGKHYYLDLIDYKKIIVQNWRLFEDIFGYGKKNTSKDKRTHWLQKVNDIRKVAMHASSGRYVKLEELEMLKAYLKWLEETVHEDEG